MNLDPRMETPCASTAVRLDDGLGDPGSPGKAAWCPDRRFWLLHGILPFALFILSAAVFEASDLDLRLSDPFYDRAAHRWPYRNSWWAEELIHTGGRKMVVVIGSTCLLAAFASLFVDGLRPYRRAALFMGLSIGLGTGIVALGKARLNRHCPWDYDRYGGKVPYVKLFEATPPGFRQGHGFPAGHASGGLSLMALYFVFRRRSTVLSIAGLGIGLFVGSVFAIGQLVRGAHFMSHNVWSAAICWFSALFLYVFAFRGRLLEDD